MSRPRRLSRAELREIKKALREELKELREERKRQTALRAKVLEEEHKVHHALGGQMSKALRASKNCPLHAYAAAFKSHVRVVPSYVLTLESQVCRSLHHVRVLEHQVVLGTQQARQEANALYKVADNLREELGRLQVELTNQLVLLQEGKNKTKRELLEAAVLLQKAGDDAAAGDVENEVGRLNQSSAATSRESATEEEEGVRMLKTTTKAANNGLVTLQEDGEERSESASDDDTSQ